MAGLTGAGPPPSGEEGEKTEIAMRMMLVLALALAPTIALAESGPGTAAPGELGNPVTGAPLGANDPPDFEPTPPPLVARLPRPMPSASAAS